MDTSNMLEKLFAQQVIQLEPVGQDTHGRKVHIHKVSLETMKPALDLITVVLTDMGVDSNHIPLVDLNDPVQILKLISMHYDEVIDIAVSLCDVPREELVKMELDQSLLVVQGVILLNKDFFMKKVLGILQSLSPKSKEKSEPEELPSNESADA